MRIPLSRCAIACVCALLCIRASNGDVFPTSYPVNPSVQARLAEVARQQAALERRILTVTPSSMERYKQFLAQPNTGAFKIAPEHKYDYAINMRGAGCYYAFWRNEHEYGHGSDIKL